MANTQTPNIGLNKPAQGDVPWDVTVNGNMDNLDSCFGGTKLVPAVQATKLLVGATDTGLTRLAAATIAVGNGALNDASGTVKAASIQLGGLALVNAGVAILVAKADLTAQSASIGSTLLYAVPANGAGTYRISAYLVVTTAASSTSALPALFVNYTDNETSVSVTPTIGVTLAGNVVGTTNTAGVSGGASTSPIQTFQAKASTNINYGTTGYASNAAGMQYAIHVKLEYLGN